MTPPSARRSRTRKKLLYTGGLTIHTTIDLRDQRAADNSVRHHVFARDQAIGALAMIQPGTGDVKAIAQSRPMGRDAQGRSDLPQLRRPAEVRRLRRLPARARRSRRSCSPPRSSRASRSRRRSPRRWQVNIPMSEYRVCGGRTFASTDTWDVHSSTIGGFPMDAYTGTQESVNTFFAKLELQTGLCEPYQLAKKMGIPLDRPRPRDGAVVHPRRRLRQPARARRRLRDVRGPRPALRPAPGDRRSTTPTATSSRRYPQQCQQVIAAPVADAVNDVLRGVQSPSGFGAALLSTRSRRPRPAPTTTTCRCGTWATRPTSPRPRWSPAPTSSDTGSR